jgi:hypothetical protein
MTDFTDDIILTLEKGNPIYLGIIGSRNDMNQTEITEEILLLILQELERPPDRVILPSEGTSSIFISDWADTLNISCQIYEADWTRHHRRAKMVRDFRIQSESTHFLVFLNKRSEFNEKLANRLAKQGKLVFTVNYADRALEMLRVEEQQQHLSLQQQSLRQVKNGNKRGIGKEQGHQQLKQLKCLENQCLLTDLWEVCS